MIRIELCLHHQEKNNHVRLLCHFCHVCAPFSFSLSTCSPVNEGDQDLSQDSNSILGTSNDWDKLEAESHLSFDKSTSLTELESLTFSAWKVRAAPSLSLINEPTLELLQTSSSSSTCQVLSNISFHSSTSSHCLPLTPETLSDTSSSCMLSWGEQVSLLHDSSPLWKGPASFSTR